MTKLDSTTLNWVRHWAVKIEESATDNDGGAPSPDASYYKGRESVASELISLIDRRLESTIGEIPAVGVIAYQGKEIERLKEELRLTKERLHQSEATLDSVDEERYSLRKENKALRKDARKSDWFVRFREEYVALQKHLRSWEATVSRLNIRVAEYERKFGKI